MLNDHCYHSGLRDLCSFLLILFFSLIPGIVKLTGNQAFFIIGYVSLAVFLSITTDRLKFKKLNLSKLAVVIFLFYGLTISIINSIFIGINDESIVIGIAIFILPIVMAILCDGVSTIRLLKLLPLVGIFHALLALVIYPYLPFSTLFGDFFTPILEGVMAFRMASVSGSLAFASLMATSFAVCVIKSRFSSDNKNFYFIASIIFLISLILSLQRSMWLAILIFMVYAVFNNFIRKTTFTLALISIIIAVTIFLAQFNDLLSSFLDLIIERIFSITSQTDDSPIGERVDQWIGVIKNIEALPFGAGVGQLGQANREGPFSTGLSGIPDGDYFRMISEYGPLGIILVFIILLKVVSALNVLVSKKKEWYSYAAASILCILALQGIGSNITELYFVNFLFFSVILNFKQITSGKIYGD